nr:hypothetical protein [Candidatus Baldrarchaeota archaeon]
MARKQVEMLEKIRDFGELIVRLEAYRENIIHSSTWPVFGIVMSSGTLIIWVMYLISMNNSLWFLVAVPSIVAILLYGWIHEKYSPKYFQERSWIMAFTFGVPIFALYIVGSLLLDLINASHILIGYFYSSISWYVALGLGMLLTGLTVERSTVKQRHLVFNSTLMVGVLSLLTSPLLIVLPLFLREIDVLPIIGGLLSLSLMLIMFLIGYLICLERAHTVLMGAKNEQQ